MQKFVPYPLAFTSNTRITLRNDACDEVSLDFQEGEHMWMRAEPDVVIPQPPKVDPDDYDLYGLVEQPPAEYVLAAYTNEEAQQALSTLRNVGGMVHVMTYDAAEGITEYLLEHGASGRENSPLIIRFSKGIEISDNIRLTSQTLLSYVVFVGLHLNAGSEGSGTEAMTLLGLHHDILFINTVCTRFKYGIGGGSDIKNDRQSSRPYNIHFHNYDLSYCVNPGRPKTSPNKTDSGFWKDKAHRAAGMYFGAVKDISFSGLISLSNIGWDMTNDPNREYTDMFSNGFYWGQGADGIMFQSNCILTIDGVANVGMVTKGRGLCIDCEIPPLITRVANGMSFGTNENPEWPCSGYIRHVVIDRLQPITHLEYKGDDNKWIVSTNAGVAMSLVNVSSLTINTIEVGVTEDVGRATCRKSTVVMVSGGREAVRSMSQVMLNHINGGDLDKLIEVRNHATPDNQSISISSVRGTDRKCQVRSTVPKNKALAAMGISLDAAPIEIW